MSFLIVHIKGFVTAGGEQSKIYEFLYEKSKSIEAVCNDFMMKTVDLINPNDEEDVDIQILEIGGSLIDKNNKKRTFNQSSEDPMSLFFLESFMRQFIEQISDSD